MKKQPIIQIICDSSSSNSNEDESEEDGSDSSSNGMDQEGGGDIIDVLYVKRNLNDCHILMVVQMLADELFPEMPNPRQCIAHIDSLFTSAYMDPPVNNDALRRRHVQQMATYFAPESEAAVTVIPIHDENHWSLMIYFNEQGVFYCFDSLDDYHKQRKLALLRRLCNDQILVRLQETRVVWVHSRRQSELFECGQYVFMFLYSFLRLLTPPPHLQQLLQQQQRQNSGQSGPGYMRTLVNDINAFEAALAKYVRTHCRPDKRLVFLRGLIAWIHERRNY